MNHKFRFLALFVFRFGIIKGLSLFFQFLMGNLNKIKLPQLKYPLSLRPKSSDISTFYDVFLLDDYKLRFDKAPETIIDGGANVGLFAIKMKNDFPNCKIICIEPDPENFQALKNNLSQYDNVYFERCGIWNKDTKLKVYDKYNSGKWGLVVEEDDINGTVPSVSIASIMKKYNLDTVDVLKLDVETSEKHIFAENYESWLPKIKTIIIELHDWIEAGCAQPFFVAITKTFNRFTCINRGENIMVVNKDLE